MAQLDIQKLLEPVTLEQPCGEDAEYDARFVAIESASRGKAEQQYGDNVIPAEPPDWPEVIRIGVALAEETKDLRIASFVARGLLAIQGLVDFVAALELIDGYISQYWDSVHPQLDPDDNLDPAIRVNTLSSLNDSHSTVTDLRNTILADAGIVGRFSLLDVDIANGEMPPKPDEEVASMANIDGAFEAAGADALLAQRDAARKLVELVPAIEAKLTAQVGAAQATSFDELTNMSKRVCQLLEQQVARLGWDEPEPEPEPEPDFEEIPAGATGEAVVARPQKVENYEIRSREDVIKTLDRLCKYYEKYEPSSPLPLILQRAKRLVPMSFLDIIQDLAPDGFLQAKAAGGGPSEEAAHGEE